MGWCLSMWVGLFGVYLGSGVFGSGILCMFGLGGGLFSNCVRFSCVLVWVVLVWVNCCCVDCSVVEVCFIFSGISLFFFIWVVISGSVCFVRWVFLFMMMVRCLLVIRV